MLVSHAIRRWRAHIPRPKDTPEPDGSWRDECPCGKPLPCDDHPELWMRVRGYRPQHIDYARSLKEFDVPYYIPTAKEIGCSEELLKKTMDPFAFNPKIPGAAGPQFDLFHGLPLGPAISHLAPKPLC